MEINDLIAEIVRLVESKLDNEMQRDKIAKRDKILVINRFYHQDCNPLKYMQSFDDIYEFDYAKNSGFRNNPADYDLVLVADVDDSVLSQIAVGIFDDAYLSLLHKSILFGKNIIISKDSIEFYQYSDTEPMAFNDYFQAKADLIKSWGIKIFSDKEISEFLKLKKIKSHSKNQVLGKDLRKRAVTKKDIIDALDENQASITILPNTIVTHIAKEFADENKIKIYVDGEHSDGISTSSWKNLGN